MHGTDSVQGRRTKSTREGGSRYQADGKAGNREGGMERQRARKRRGEATAIPDFHFN